MKSPDHLASLEQIRDIMERSTMFVSLTGLSGIMAGVYAIVLYAVIAVRLGSFRLDAAALTLLRSHTSVQLELGLYAIIALILAFLTSVLLTYRRAARQHQPTWSPASRQFALHLTLPLAVGGLFVVVFMGRGAWELLAGTMLLFYGLAQASASRFVRKDMFWLGLFNILLGAAAMFLTELALLFWVVGFGAATILYGAVMYIKYER